MSLLSLAVLVALHYHRNSKGLEGLGEGFPVSDSLPAKPPPKKNARVGRLRLNVHIQ